MNKKCKIKSSVDFNPKYATVNFYGDVTAKNQKGYKLKLLSNRKGY